MEQKSKQNSNQEDNQNSKKNKSRFCSHCKVKTHNTDKCWSLDKSKQKQINSMDVSQDNQQGQCQDSNNEFGIFNALCAVDHKLPVISTFATKLASHPLATNESLMTKLNLEDVFQLGMEVDTAASHNIISEESFNELQTRLFRQNKEKTKKLSRGVKIRLADGSMADQECPVVQINVSTDLCDFSNPVVQTF